MSMDKRKCIASLVHQQGDPAGDLPEWGRSVQKMSVQSLSSSLHHLSAVSTTQSVRVFLAQACRIKLDLCTCSVQ